MKEIINKIKQYNRIIIVRHQRPDGDCMGSSLGLRAILRESFPEKEIYSVGKTKLDYLAFIGDEDEITPDMYNGALVIAVDTAGKKRIDDDYYENGDFLIKIDHHIAVEDYGDINYVEENQPAACCMITKLWYENKDVLKMTDEAAIALFVGTVTDTGRFRYSGVDSNCLMLTALLLDYNINLEQVYAKLYMKEPKYYALQGEVLRKFKTTENVAYVYITKAMQEKLHLTPEEAANTVNLLDSLQGILSWVAFIDQPDGTIRVRLRSRFCPINKIGEKYNGGGHANASGATVKNRKEMAKLIVDLDKEVEEFKRSNTGWL